MSFRSKVIKTYETVKSCGKKSLRKISQITKHSKSSTHRQIKKIQSRSNILGASFFETADGALWLRRLVFATILVFGLQGNIGEGRISLFFQIICITAFIGLSARSVGRLKKTMMHMLQKYQSELQPTLDKLAEKIGIVAGADETFFDNLLILLFMELSSGYIFVEESTPNRKSSTWHSVTQSTFNKFKECLCLTSDRAKSLIKFAKMVKTKSIAELFHLQDSTVRLFKFAFASKRRTLQKKQKEAAKELDNLISNKATAELIQAQEAVLQTIADQNTLINKGQSEYRKQLKLVSTATHPFDKSSKPKTSAVLTQELHSSLVVFKNIAKDCGIVDKNNHLGYFEKNISDISQLIDLWWQWVDVDLSTQECDAELINWIKTKLLPFYYWGMQIKKSRGSKELKAYYKELHIKAEAELFSDQMTEKYITTQWVSWAKSWVCKFQRSSSQVEGHNARLSETHQCLRGMNPLHLKTDVILNNCWIVREDGTTATERLFKFKPPDLFEWLVNNMPELPLPRNRKNKFKSSTNMLSAILSV